MRQTKYIGLPALLIGMIVIIGCYAPEGTPEQKPADQAKPATSQPTAAVPAPQPAPPITDNKPAPAAQPASDVKPASAPQPAQPASEVKPAPTPPPALPATDVKPTPVPASAPIPATSALKIGVINLVDVFARYDKTKDYEKLLEREKQKEEVAIKELENQIKKLEDELETLNKNSDLYREKKEQLASLIGQREYKVKNWNEYIKNRVNEQTLKIYKDIRDAIDAYAQDNGFTYIFKSDPILSTTPETDDVTMQINIRTVLYFPKSTDITDDIVKILNKEK